MSFSAVSYNQPKFSPCASWHQVTTYESCTPHDSRLSNIFVDTSNTIYEASYRPDMKIGLCSGSDSTPLSIISTTSSFNESLSLFVTINGSIYLNNGNSIYHFNKSKINKPTTRGMIAMNVTSKCTDLFIDFTNSLYCSMTFQHKVVKLLLEYDDFNEEEIVAGNEASKSMSYSLNCPHGIFVDIELNLYVADSGNHRIQLFQHGNTTGTTVAGNKALGKYGLDFPTGIVLDADGYLFITDRHNQRIIRSEINGFRCVIGCFEHDGSQFHPYSYHHPHYHPYHDFQLHGPQVLWFDSYGNMFVLDHSNENHRVQEFRLSTNSCGMFKNIEFDYENL